MALHQVDGKITHRDIRPDRIAAGTVGGEHIVPRSITGGRVNSLIDNTNPSIQYGFYSTVAGTGYFDHASAEDFVFGGTRTIIGSDGSVAGVANSALRYKFNGTSIAVIGAYNEDSGALRVYIDGVETAGRTGTLVPFRLGYFGNTGNPVITATDTTIPALAGATAFPATGTLYIDGELVTYTSRDTNGFYGCTRGTSGTIAREHSANETIYNWASTTGLSTNVGCSASKQIVYYNPLLPPGEHEIIVRTELNAVNNRAMFYFDGLLTGSLLGADSIFTQTAQATITFNTDANGHCDVGTLVQQNNDVSKISIIGYTQTSCETSNTTIMGKLGIKTTAAGVPQIYCHNGPISASVTWNIFFGLIGETI